MNYEYTLNPDSEEPIMLIDSHIGYSNENGRGVMADQFCRELMFLDTLGKSRVQVWMNSVGGSVLDAQQIYNTILRTKTKVDTYCVGLVASSAGFIFQAGRKRCMMDGTNLMMHNPFNPTNPDEESDSLRVFTNSIVTMICSRSGLTPEKVGGMMNVTTWLNAEDCKAMGLCDEVEYLDSFNKARKVSIENPLNALKEYSNIIQEIKPKKMNKVYNKLNLDPAVNGAEDSAVAAIENLVVANKTTTDKLTTVEAELIEAKNKVTELTAKVKEVEDSEAAKEATELENKVTSLVDGAVTAGKIANEATIIDAYKVMAKADLVNTTKVIEALPVNKKAPSFTGAAKKAAELENSAAPSIDITNPSGYLAQMQVKKLAELKNKFKK